MRIVACLLIIVSFTGCAGASKISRNQVHIESDSAVVAFSVTTSNLPQYELDIRPMQFTLSDTPNADSIIYMLRPDSDGVQNFVYEISGPSVTLDDFQFHIDRRYATSVAGPKLSLASGEITYLGRLEIQDVQFAENSTDAIVKLVAIKMAFTDESESDFVIWEKQYKLFKKMKPQIHIVEKWGDSEYTPVKSKINWDLVLMPFLCC